MEEKIVDNGINKAEEVVDFLTAVMRGEVTERVPERVRASDFLGRYYGLWSGRGMLGDEFCRVIISGEELLED